MDRRAIILNLRDIRDLEVAKVVAERNRDEELASFDNKIKALSTKHYKQLECAKTTVTAFDEEYSDKNMCGGVLALVPFIWGICWLFSGGFFRIAFGICLVGIFGLYEFCAWGEVIEVERKRKADEASIERTLHDNEKIREYNKQEDKRVAANAPEIARLRQERHQRELYWEKEIENIENMLRSAYDINVIPSIYRRNLAAIQYIYEYMSTSQTSLEHVLMSTTIESGIMRIERKLDRMLNTLIDSISMMHDETIFEMRRLEAQNKQAMRQNENMLATLQRSEANTADAAQYARLSTNYAQTSAFFALVDYLDN